MNRRSRAAGLTLIRQGGHSGHDNNIVQRSIRLLALTRKNSLFAGSDGGADHWAILALIIEAAELNDIDPQAYITSVIARVVAGHQQSRIDQLMP